MTDCELMQQAVEKLEFFERMRGVSEDTRRLIAALRERLERPEQEPVATVVERQYEDGTYAGNALDWAGRNCEDDFPAGTKLYTAPQPVKFNCTVVDDAHPEGVPLSQWGRQPLTEATIRDMCEHVPDYDISTHDLIEFARAIEAAHGITGEKK